LDGHCLGVLFSNKAFASRVLGLAWKGDPKKQSGICQKRRREVLLKNSRYQFHQRFTHTFFVRKSFLSLEFDFEQTFVCKIRAKNVDEIDHRCGH